MHGNEHGNSILCVKCTVRAVRDFEVDLRLPSDTLVKRMKDRLLGLCDSSVVQHMTLLTLGNQKILEGWDTLNKELKTKKKERSQPIVDANDVAKLMLALVFVLDGLGQPELEAHNSKQTRPQDRVREPFKAIIGALNKYLHAYHMYRAEALRESEINQLDTLSRNALETLQKVFPYGVRYRNGTFRSWFCTEKPHSMTHWADNYATVGRIRIISTSPTETRMKTAVKIPSRKTNNQASFGGSLLKNNMEVEAAMEMQRHLDETGLSLHHLYMSYLRVCTMFDLGLLNRIEQTVTKKVCIWFAHGLHGLHVVCTLFAHSLSPTSVLSGEKHWLGILQTQCKHRANHA